MRLPGLRAGVALMIAALVLWFFSYWLRLSSGLSMALDHSTRAGEVIGGAGEALATALFVAACLIIAGNLVRRRR
jgi:hypothetical protein